MRSLSLALGLMVGLAALPAFADHKPGHHIPPGHLKKHGVMAPPAAAPRVNVAPPTVSARVIIMPQAASTPVVGGDPAWRTLTDDNYQFQIDVPYGLFSETEHNRRGLKLTDPTTGAVVDIYGAANTSGYSPAEFVAAIEEADRVSTVTYRAGGQSWFVLSGYYADNENGEPVIFYTKFMFSADRSRVSAFEISYPADQKRRYDRVVSRMEHSLTSPR